MPNDTVRASAPALPKSRRLFLIAGTSGALLATLKGAAAASEIVVDDEILALAAEVERLGDRSWHIQETRIDPFQEEFLDLIHARAAAKEPLEDAWAFSRRCGREDAIDKVNAIDAEADRHFRAMIAIPARTQAGRAAKVRAFLLHAGGPGWRGPSEEIDWPQEQARKLLAEFAGMTEAEIANV